MDEIKKFWSTKLFQIDGFTFTIGVAVLLIAVYWIFFMRK
jgi:hypothetical protein